MLLSILNNFFDEDLRIEEKDIKKHGEGKINHTFLIQTKENKKYILQKLNLNNFFSSKKQLEIVLKERLKVYLEIKKNLKKFNFILASLLPLAKNKKKYFLKYKNEYYVLFEFIEHDKKVKKTPELSFEALKYLGNFHKLSKKYNLKIRYSLPHFHDTKYFLDKLKKFKKHQDFYLVQKEFSFLMKETPKYFFSKTENILIHGDPKIQNFLFQNNKVKTVIDWETMMMGSNLIDLGDALRSFAIDNKFKNNFSKEIFQAGVNGYNEGLGKKINIKTCKQAFNLLNLELIIRYLIDFFEEKLFSWDNNKYKNLKEHNLYRVRSRLTIYNNLSRNFSK